MLHFIQQWSDEIITKVCTVYNSPLLQNIVSRSQTLEFGDSLQERMTRYIKEHNGKKCHCFKPHIISLKSKTLLTHLNFLTKLDEKLECLKEYNTILERVCAILYSKYDPHMIYAFNNEIHLVFYPNDEGNFLFDGDISKTLTMIVSYASICFTKEIKGTQFEVDCVFEGNFVEFGKDYEVLNYIIWRQLDCKRNTVTLLYKCINYDGILDNMMTLDKISLLELQKEVYNKVSSEALDRLMYGGISKKQIVYIETDSKQSLAYCWKEGDQVYDEDKIELVKRKIITVKHIPLWVNFKSNLYEYVVNKTTLDKD